MDRKSLRYWEDLDVPLEDIIEQGEKSKARIINRLAHRLKNEEEWPTIIETIFNIKEQELKEKIKKLYEINRDAFYGVLAASLFADNIRNIGLVEEKAKIVLEGKQAAVASKLKIKGTRAHVYLIYLSAENALIDLYYDDLLNRSSLKSYASETSVRVANPFKDLGRREIQSILTSHELSQAKSRRRRNKVWWVINEGTKLKIFFRREKKGKATIRQVMHNAFVKTAEWKIFVFNKDSTNLEIFSKKDPKKTLKIADFIGEKLFGTERGYKEKIVEISSSNLDRLINDIKNSVVKVYNLSVRNIPLDESPTIELDSANEQPINKAIVDLSTHVDLFSDSSNLISARLTIKGTMFNLRFRREGGQIIITTTNKGYSENEKRKIGEYFGEVNGGKKD